MRSKKIKRTKKEKQNKNKENNLLYAGCALIVIMALSLFNLALYIQPKKTELIEVVHNNNNYTYWYKFLEDHPDYFPGWLELARIEYQQGDLINAKKALGHAEKINPTAEELKYLKLIYGF